MADQKDTKPIANKGGDLAKPLTSKASKSSKSKSGRKKSVPAEKEATTAFAGHCSDSNCRDEKCDSKGLTAGKLQELQKAMNMMNLYHKALPDEAAAVASSTVEEAMQREFKFWKTQPVPQFSKFGIDHLIANRFLPC